MLMFSLIFNNLLLSRRKHQLANHFTKIDDKYRDKVLYISMDMWEPYRDIAHLYFKNVKICVDNLHKKIQLVIKYDDVDSNRHISNGPIESVNSRIKLIKRNANGYRNFERLRKRVLYSLNRKSFFSFKYFF